MNLSRALLALGVPVVWAIVLWAAWHFAWVPVLLPLSLFILAVPATFAHVGVVSLRGVCVGGRAYGGVVTVLAILSFVVAYASSLYAIGRVAELLPEIYKFGSSLVDVSRSTVRLWVLLTVGCLAVSWSIVRSALTSTRASLFARSTIGMVTCTSVIFIPFLLSPCASYRA